MTFAKEAGIECSSFFIPLGEYDKHVKMPSEGFKSHAHPVINLSLISWNTLFLIDF
ncbi:hypothetical protein [Bacillus sp. FJAT-27231]|uniref:hypothetical protein n=1 Tax=Bacillus sp. FJAT-27231 TaxID=1679168 RepID=UPI0012E1671F|nr:hypothetical protein [Bacillus sp. FJAT-27231]